ncbi:MAG: hypothetical protein KDK66_02285 [Deltaproteobacteria bacterium]|nr:hypothetical protein [Deltaproteobacteria bacterium]
MAIKKSPTPLAIIDNNTLSLVKLAGGTEQSHKLHRLKDSDPKRDYYLVQDTQGLCSDQYASKGLCISKLTLITVRPGEKGQVLVDSVQHGKTAKASLDFFFSGLREKTVSLGSPVPLGVEIYLQESPKPSQSLMNPSNKPSFYQGLDDFLYLSGAWAQERDIEAELTIKDLHELLKNPFKFPEYDSFKYDQGEAQDPQTKAELKELEKDLQKLIVERDTLEEIDAQLDRFEKAIYTQFKNPQLRAIAYSAFAEELREFSLNFSVLYKRSKETYPQHPALEKLAAYHDKLRKRANDLAKAQDKTMSGIFKTYLKAKKPSKEQYVLAELAYQVDMHELVKLGKDFAEPFTKKLSAERKARAEKASPSSQGYSLKIKLSEQNFEYRLP